MTGRAVLRILLFLSCTALISDAQSSFVQPRVTQPVDSRTVQLRGNVHPLARPEYDRGILPDDQPLDRMLLLLKRSDEQESALRQLLDEQQTQGSARYHSWLTPEEFGRQFGPADADIQVVADWLASQGFLGIHVTKGKLGIEFTGSAGQVRNAFHTEIHKFMVKGQVRNANVSDPQIPAALAPVVVGVVSLHNFPRKPHVKDLGTFRREKATGEITPLFTFPFRNGFLLGVGPTDFATIYNVLPLWNSNPPIDGTGQTIAVVGDSNIDPTDVQAFRTMFSLPTGGAANTPQVIPVGPDPGINPDEVEAALDVQWAGALAKNAQILLVTAESPTTAGVSGPDLAALYTVDNNLADVMSESFGDCEANLGQTVNQFESSLWQQASAQGITAMASTGDSGSAGCDNPGVELVAAKGIAVSGVASTPFNVAVGGTDFNSSLTNYLVTYWNQNNGAGQGSAKSYIPEITWNATCAAAGLTTGCTATIINNDAKSNPGIDLVAASGGVSTFSAKPSWQTGTGVPADGQRDLPDLSLFSSNGINGSFYIFCQKDANPPAGSASSCDLNSPFNDFQGGGGTSFASPIFASIVALVNQYQVNHGGSKRQGNVNYVLYPMAAKAGASCTSNASAPGMPGCIFYDLSATAGNISVACAGGSPNCNNTTAGASQYGIIATTAGGTTPAYNTTAGYDLATGLGSVNVANLVTNWAPGSFRASTTTFTLNNGMAVSTTHGTAVPVSGMVSAQSGGGTPTGIVELVEGTPASPGPVLDTFTLSSGAFSGSTRMLPGTTTGYQVFAHYGGDGTFAASNSATQNVTSISKENSVVTVNFVTFSTTGAPILSTNPSPVQYGSNYVLRVDVTNAGNQQCSSTAGIPCPTGTVTELDNGAPLNDFLVPNTKTLTNSAQLNNLGFLEDQPIQLPVGLHNITASYAGDASYNAQPNSNHLSVTIQQATTQTGLGASPSTGVLPNTQVTLTATITSTSNSSIGPGGTVKFFDGGTQLGNATTVTTVGNGGTATTTATFALGNHSLTAQYSGDQNYAASSTTSATVLTSNEVAFTAPAVTVTRGISMNFNVTVNAAPGFNGQVTVTCTIPPGMNEATCTPASQTVTVVGGTGTAASLTIAAAAPHVATLYRNSRWAAFGFILLGAVLLAVPGRRRSSTLIAVMMLLVLLLAGGPFGCGGGGGGGGTGTQDPGTPVGTYSVSLAAMQNGATVGSGTVMVTVQ